ncbi:MAG TPA: ATP-binding protein [Anaeromyxobacteraceae bacterium]|nr:ATP-binding protein [Anaeromyxobacteraceae bacterium]
MAHTGASGEPRRDALVAARAPALAGDDRADPAELLEFGDALAEFDRDWRYVRVNANYEKIARKPRSQILGQVVWELFPDTARRDSRYWVEFNRCMRERVPVEFEDFYAPLDLWTAINGYPTSTGGVALFIRDITQQKRAEEALRRSEEKLRLAKEAARMGAWDWNVVSGELIWSERCKALFGLPPDAPMSYERFLAAIAEEDRAAVDAAVRRALQMQEPYEAEMRVPLPDGGIRWIASHGHGYYVDGKPVRMAGMAMDVTRRKLAEEALREADRRKDAFLAVLSHELRNPLAPIRNSIYVIEHAPREIEAGRRALEVLRRQAEQLARLVDDLLDVARITHQKLELQLSRIELGEVVRRAWADARGLFEQRGVALRTASAGEPLWVDADAARLSQIVANLLNNALKFTPPGGQVTVATRRRGPDCEVMVRDTGLGIAAADLERIFSPFVQAGEGPRGGGGLGIGLALVQELVARHGGSVRAESGGPGRGADFVIALPARAGPGAEATPGPAATDGTGGALSVLVVDDNEDAAATLADLLALMGHRVATAGTGRAAIDAVARSRPDVLVCDIGLPDLSGLEVIRTIRAAAAGDAAIFAVALTGFAQPEDRRAALGAGFDAHLPKPPPLEQLEALLREAALRRNPPAAP